MNLDKCYHGRVLCSKCHPHAYITIIDEEIIVLNQQIAALRSENDRLKTENERLLNADLVWRNKYGMIQDDLAKAWADKRELVEELERCLYRTDAVYLAPAYNSLKALIAKHKEAL